VRDVLILDTIILENVLRGLGHLIESFLGDSKASMRGAHRLAGILLRAAKNLREEFDLMVHQAANVRTREIWRRDNITLQFVIELRDHLADGLEPTILFKQ